MEPELNQPDKADAVGHRSTPLRQELPLITQRVIRLIKQANPGIHLPDHRIRGLIRAGTIDSPHVEAGMYYWSKAGARALAEAIGAVVPREFEADATSFEEANDVREVAP